jgi:hypothetical protein
MTPGVPSAVLDRLIATFVVPDVAMPDVGEQHDEPATTTR